MSRPVSIRRFRISAILALQCAAAVAFAWVASELRSFERQSRAIEALETMGQGPTTTRPVHAYVRIETRPAYRGWLARMPVEKPYVDVVDVRIMFVSGPCPSELLRLSDLRNLTSLDLSGDVGGEALDALLRCRKLETLYLRDTRFADDEIARLAALPRLQALLLGSSRASWRCLPALAASPALKLVEINEPSYDDPIPDGLLATLPFKVTFAKLPKVDVASANSWGHSWAGLCRRLRCGRRRFGVRR